MTTEIPPPVTEARLVGLVSVREDRCAHCGHSVCLRPTETGVIVQHGVYTVKEIEITLGFQECPFPMGPDRMCGCGTPAFREAALPPDVVRA